MTSRNENIAVFRTAGDAHVTVRIVDEGMYDAACKGCGWTETSRQAIRAAAGVIGRPTGPLSALKHDANTHALRCAEVPRDRWPGEVG